MNKKGRVTPYQVIGFLSLRMPLYRLQELGEITLKESYVASFEEKSKSRSSEPHSPELGLHSTEGTRFDRIWVEFARMGVFWSSVWAAVLSFDLASTPIRPN